MSKYRDDRAYYKRQRARKHAENPHCHWCGVLTHLPGTRNAQGRSHQMATIDHLYPKGHPKRLDGNPGKEIRRVLACRRCNNARKNPYTVHPLPHSLEEAWRAAGHWPRMAYLHGALPGEA